MDRPLPPPVSPEKPRASPRAEKRLDADVVKIAFALVRTAGRAAALASRCTALAAPGFLLAMRRGLERGAALAAPGLLLATRRGRNRCRAGCSSLPLACSEAILGGGQSALAFWLQQRPARRQRSWPEPRRTRARHPRRPRQRRPRQSRFPISMAWRLGGGASVGSVLACVIQNSRGPRGALSRGGRRLTQLVKRLTKPPLQAGSRKSPGAAAILRRTSPERRAGNRRRKGR